MSRELIIAHYWLVTNLRLTNSCGDCAGILSPQHMGAGGMAEGEFR
jgi:hypothetical protein